MRVGQLGRGCPRGVTGVSWFKDRLVYLVYVLLFLGS